MDEARSHLVGKLRSYVRDLVDPWTGVEAQWVDRVVVVDGVEVVERVPVHHRIEHASLLDQLRVPPSASVQGGGSGPGSRPPASLEAVSLLRVVVRDSERWACDVLGRGFVAGVAASLVDPVARTRVLLTQLARRGPVMDADDLEVLSRSVLRWWAAARNVTAWDSPPVKPHVPCPECGEWGRVEVRTGPFSAACRSCHAAWDSESVDVLGDAVAAFLRVHVEVMRGPDAVGAHVDRWARGPARAGAAEVRGPEVLLQGVRTEDVLGPVGG